MRTPEKAIERVRENQRESERVRYRETWAIHKRSHSVSASMPKYSAIASTVFGVKMPA